MVHVREHEPEDGIGLLRAGELDLLVSERYEGVEPAPAGGLEEHLLLTEPLLLALPGGESSEPVSLDAYRDAAWIGGRAGTQYAVAVEQACRTAGFAPRIVHRADEATVIQALAASGLAVGFLPALACTGMTPLRYVKAVPAPPSRLVHALVRGGAARRPALAAVVGALRERAGTSAAARQGGWRANRAGNRVT